MVYLDSITIYWFRVYKGPRGRVRREAWTRYFRGRIGKGRNRKKMIIGNVLGNGYKDRHQLVAECQSTKKSNI